MPWRPKPKKKLHVVVANIQICHNFSTLFPSVLHVFIIDDQSKKLRWTLDNMSPHTRKVSHHRHAIMIIIYSQYCTYTFSNSLIIIHEEKTKEITTMKEEVWYVILIIIKFSELLLWISLTIIINALWSYTKHSKGCFIKYPNTSKLVKKTSSAPRF